jgi:4-hydroxy-L-threonine phosphate dehydrogenase PdxA
MNSICILLTDHESINEKIILKSFTKIKKSKLKKIYFVGDRKYFSKIFQIIKNIKKINFINVNLNKKKNFQYIQDITKIGISLYRRKLIHYLINMPLDKRKFFNKKFAGFTEFYSFNFDKKKNENMLLYNNIFSVCPLTTHIPLQDVNKTINKNKLINCIKNINFFFKKKLKKKIEMIVLGINPHASQDMSFRSKDFSLIERVVKLIKNRIKIKGPVSSDTAFTKLKNKVFIGMYHDQVLIPFKMKNNFDGINITIGKKLIRLSPDHGTGKDLIKKPKKINNTSFVKCLEFCEKY